MMKSLRYTHPNLWLVSIASAVALFWLGAANTFINNTSPSYRFTRSVAPLWFFGVQFLLCAAMMTYGLWRSVFLYRLSLALSAGLVSLWSLGLTLAIVADLATKHQTPGSGAPAVYFFFAVSLVAQAREPRTNPDAVRR